MNEELEKIKKDIAKIRERNLRVEEDKAWETSYCRLLLLHILSRRFFCISSAQKIIFGVLLFPPQDFSYPHRLCHLLKSGG